MQTITSCDQCKVPFEKKRMPAGGYCVKCTKEILNHFPDPPTKDLYTRKKKE